MKKGDYEEANLLLNEVLLDPNTDAEYEKLLVARTLQAQAECAKEKKNTNAYNDRMYRMYQFYPQLIPYTGLTMNMNLHIAGTEDKELTGRLRDCNINWKSNAALAPQAYLIFSNAGGKKKVEYYVLDGSGNYIVQKHVLPYKNAGTAATQLAYRLFNIGGSVPAKPKTSSSSI